ncbi:hypothetical protein [Noviherbaspirillum suwonense]|jgi:hypothetical protein|uniref:Uncharacterized protein n=1 Tax=Noviherbaspirillum suwonense TaxID=1224511 RepID=A0ABY1QFD3_9BURK|nr:hypothetical protein [Noviherbaspirillum suwonense]SMP68073.1 hypothetical protein SAMN06295970_11397 [Noviherbaspirillum suwonense]
MSDQNDKEQFAADLEQRFKDVMQWAVTTWPDSEHPVSLADFGDVEKAVKAISQRFLHPSGEALSPSEGGAQFVDVSPAPWP